MMCWLCHPVIWVIFCWHIGQIPSCPSQRCRNCRLPVKFRAILTPRRFSKYTSHAGSKGLAFPWMTVCRWIFTSPARLIWTGFLCPSSSSTSPVNTQLYVPYVVKYFCFTQVALLRGCLLLSHHHSFLKIALSTELKVLLLAPKR